MELNSEMQRALAETIATFRYDPWMPTIEYRVSPDPHGWRAYPDIKGISGLPKNPPVRAILHKVLREIDVPLENDMSPQDLIKALSDAVQPPTKEGDQYHVEFDAYECTGLRVVRESKELEDEDLYQSRLFQWHLNKALKDEFDRQETLRSPARALAQAEALEAQAREIRKRHQI